MVVEYKTVKQRVPADLLTCREFPGKPAADATQRDLVPWAGKAWLAYRDCWLKLKTVGDLVEKE